VARDHGVASAEGGGEGEGVAREGVRETDASRVIYGAMNKTRTKCIQDDATRAANTGVIFAELKIFYDAMTPRCDLRPESPPSGGVGAYSRPALRF